MNSPIRFTIKITPKKNPPLSYGYMMRLSTDLTSNSYIPILSKKYNNNKDTVASTKLISKILPIIEYHLLATLVINPLFFLKFKKLATNKSMEKYKANKIFKTNEVRCPYCRSEDLNYVDKDPATGLNLLLLYDPNSCGLYYFNIRCNACGKKSREYHSTNFEFVKGA